MLFLGNAPELVQGDLGKVFDGMGFTDDFTIYYFSGKSGFASPTWEGHRAIRIDESLYPTMFRVMSPNYWARVEAFRAATLEKFPELA